MPASRPVAQRDETADDSGDDRRADRCRHAHAPRWRQARRQGDGDRAPLAILDALVPQLYPAALARGVLLIIATVHEEVGTIGAAAVARDLAVERALILDVAPDGDAPGPPEDWYPVALGAGPVLPHRDAAVAYSRGICREIHDAAQAADVPLQDGAFPIYVSDGREFHAGGHRRPCLPSRPAAARERTGGAGDAAQRAPCDGGDDSADDEVGAGAGEVVVAAGVVGAHGRDLARVTDRDDGPAGMYAGAQRAGAYAVTSLV